MILKVNGLELDVDYSISDDRVVITKVTKDGQKLESSSRGEYLIKTINNMHFTVKRTEIMKALPEYNKNLW